MKKILFLLLLLAFFGIPEVKGQEINFPKFGIETNDSHIPEGLKPGDKAPFFTGYDQSGKTVDLNKLLAKGPVVLFFYRGKWCPVCSRYLKNYQDSLNIITDQGFNVVAITPESIENVEQTISMNKITFTVIYDCQEQIMHDFDVMFTVTKDYQNKVFAFSGIEITKNNGHDPAHLPVPATYIINRQGIITAVQFDADYQKRASVKWMLQNLGGAL
jgi:peroxiredoxin